MIRCDLDGTPKMVQKLRYTYHNMMYEAVLFTGERVKLVAEYASPTVGLRDMPTEKEMLEAELVISNLAVNRWGETDHRWVGLPP